MSTIGWECVGVFVDSCNVVANWNVKKNVSCLLVELKVLNPQVVAGVKLGYDGASFVEIECSIDNESKEWKILLPKTTLRTFVDVSNKMNETNRIMPFTTEKFSKTLQAEKIYGLRFKLEQPFEPQCAIGFNSIELLNSCQQMTPSPQKTSLIKSVLKRNDSIEKSPNKTNKETISQLITKLTSNTPKSLRLMKHLTIVLDPNKDASSDISKLIKEMGGTCTSKIPTKKYFFVLQDLYDCTDNTISSSKFVNSKWVSDCYKKQIRIPLMNYQTQKSKKTFEKFRPAPVPLIFEDSSDEEMDVDTLCSQEYGTSVDTGPSSEEWEVLAIPNFLSGICVGFSGDITDTHKRFLSRYIIAYGGLVVAEWKSNFITHLLREKSPPWPEELQKDIKSHPFGNFAIVSPEWIIACHNKLLLEKEHLYLWID